MSARDEEIRAVVRRVIEADREARGLPSTTEAEAAEDALVEIARLARRPR